ncbi:MAG: hlyA 5 [Verrucomicrobiales bacterium]|nr:hlyA 5 [Verrucomicrobiales bacterium]
MEVEVAGATPGWIMIEASTDLQNWSQLTKVQATDQPFSYLDYVAEIFPQRYYRATQFGTPPNDNFAQREFLQGTNILVTGWTFNATSEDGEPAIATIEQGTNSVWWSWTAPATGKVSISTVGTFWDTLIGVFTGTEITGLVPVAQFPWYTRELNFPVQAGVVCQIAVAGSEGQSGPLNLSLNFAPNDVQPVPQLAGSSVNLVPYQYPDFSNYSLIFSGDAKQCVFQSVDDSTVRKEDASIGSYEVQDSSATLNVETGDNDQKNAHTFKFSFQSPRAGSYVHLINDTRADSGEFTNFRSEAGPLALKDLSGVKITGTRVWTTTGTSGQSHHYTFNHGGHFHDSDGQEQATGRYQYQANDSTASLILNYTGPADFSGDHHELNMTYTSVNGGTFSSHYTKNDGTEITILGDFVIDED